MYEAVIYRIAGDFREVKFSWMPVYMYMYVVVLADVDSFRGPSLIRENRKKLTQYVGRSS